MHRLWLPHYWLIDNLIAMGVKKIIRQQFNDRFAEPVISQWDKRAQANEMRVLKRGRFASISREPDLSLEYSSNREYVHRVCVFLFQSHSCQISNLLLSRLMSFPSACSADSTC